MILVAGSANLDFITPVEHIPAPGETVLGRAYRTAPGGKGANQAVACARAGGEVAFLGALGNDPFAQILRDSLLQSGAEVRAVTVEAPTGAAFISVSQAGENAITVASGANAYLRAEHLPQLSGLKYLVMQLEIPVETVQTYAEQAKRAGVQVILNAAPARALPPELLSQVDLLVVNEGELETLVGAGELTDKLRRAQELGPQTVIVTLGGQGSVALSGQDLLEVPAYRVQVVDTTGAGDTFVGVLTAALSEGKGLRDAMTLASVGAALACTKPGAQPSMPSRAAILEAASGQGRAS